MAILAAGMALGASSIDLVLPAFPEMRSAFGLGADSNEVSLVVTSFFLGLAAGQLFYGPLSDRLGRRPLMFVGLGLYAVGAGMAALAPDLGWMVVGRFVWGLGAAGPRSLALAIVRDVYEGDRMARIMSQILAIFLLVPMFAPSLGAGLIALGSWRLVFWLPVGTATAMAAWVALRLHETLPAAQRRSMRPAVLGEAATAVLRTRRTVVLTLAGTFLFGIMTGYVGSSQIIVEEVFGVGHLFPLLFGVLGAVLAGGSLLSARLVMRFGTVRLLRWGTGYLVSVAAAMAVLAVATGGHPPLWAFMVAAALVLPGVMSLVPSLNSEAMAPLPHVAGMAAALIGTTSTALGAVVGAVIDAGYDGTITPFALGTLACAVAAAVCVLVSGGEATPRVPPPWSPSSGSTGRTGAG